MVTDPDQLYRIAEWYAGLPEDGAVPTRYVVPVERCEHGKIDPHSAYIHSADVGGGLYKECKGAT